MLHFIRERAQGWVAWFIVGLISIPFALWGINSYLGGGSDVTVATVNGKIISQSQYQRAIQQYRERMRGMLGEQFHPELFDSVEMKRSVLNGLIEQKLLASASIDLGQKVSDAQLARMIQSTPAFQKEGVFDNQYYSLVLGRAGLSPALYETELRADMLNQELISNLQQSVLVTDTLVDNVLRLEKQSREIAYGVVLAESQLADVIVKDMDVKAYFDANREQYMAPERVAVDYIELSIEALKQDVEVDDILLKQFYADNEGQFLEPEQRRVSHILIEGGDGDAKAAALAAKSRLDAREDFARLAQELSQDLGSANKGGDLGFFQKGVMDEAFEKAAFALENIDDVSNVVESIFGYHLIKLTDIKVPEGKSFADAKADVESLYRYQQAEALFYEKAELLADLTYENPDNLDVAAEELELTINSTEAFTRNGGNGLASNKKVVNVAFSEDVLKNDLNSAIIELSKSHLAVIHKKEHIEASLLPYESVAPAITELLRFEQAREKAKQLGQSYLADLKNGVDPSSLFDGDTWRQTQTYTRTSDNVSRQILEHAFAVAKPTASSQYTGFTASNGNYIVVKVVAVTNGKPAEASQEQRDSLVSHLNRIARDSQSQAFIASLKADADIVILEENL